MQHVYLHHEPTEKLWKIKRAPVSDPKATCSPDLDPGVVDKLTGSFSAFTKFPLHICEGKKYLDETNIKVLSINNVSCIYSVCCRILSGKCSIFHK